MTLRSPVSTVPPGAMMFRAEMHFGEISRTQSVGRETILRIVQIDGLRQNAPPLHLGNFGSSLRPFAQSSQKNCRVRHSCICRPQHWPVSFVFPSDRG